VAALGSDTGVPGSSSSLSVAKLMKQKPRWICSQDPLVMLCPGQEALSLRWGPLVDALA
jgi:hypothetical protein